MNDLILDLSESRECLTGALAQFYPEPKMGAYVVMPGREVLNRRAIGEVLRGPWRRVLLVCYRQEKTRILPWYLAAASLAHGEQIWIYEHIGARLARLSKLGSVIKAGWRITLDAAWAAYYLAAARIDLARLRGKEGLVAGALPERLNITFLRCDAYVGAKSGGSVGHLAGVINSMANAGHAVSLFSSDYLEEVDYGKVSFQEPKNGFPGWNIPIAGGGLFTDYAVTKLAERVLDLNQKSKPGSAPNLLYHRFHLGTLGALRLRRRFGIPLILEFNGSEVWVRSNWGVGSGMADRFLLDLENQALHDADAVVVVSDVLREQLVKRGITREKIISVPNGVDPAVFDPAHLSPQGQRIRQNLGWGDKQVVGFVGTFGRWHGTDVLAEAINRIAGSQPQSNLRFLMVGDGQLRPDFEKALSAPATSLVHMAGRLPQHVTPAYLASCDAFVSPHVANPDGTRFFGSPTKLFEYMAMGKPIFASNLEQIGEILSDQKTAILLPPGQADELANALNRFSKAPATYEELAIAARREVLARYTWQAHWDYIEAEFRKMQSLNTSAAR